MISIITRARALRSLKSQRRQGEMERFSLRALRLCTKQFQSALFRIRSLLDFSGDDESRLDDLVTELCTIVQSSVMHGGLVEVVQAGVDARKPPQDANPD